VKQQVLIRRLPMNKRIVANTATGLTFAFMLTLSLFAAPVGGVNTTAAIASEKTPQAVQIATISASGGVLADH
jgi:hypothetical protein